MKKFNYILLSAMILSLFIFAGCSLGKSTSEKTAQTNSTITIEHKLGKTVVPKNPKRIVVIDYGILDSLDKLGVDGIVGVPQDVLPKYLSKYKDKKYTNIGNLMELNFETISSLKPDLIIISGRQERSYKELSAIAPTIDLQTDEANYLPSFQKNMHILGEIFSKEKQVETELTKIDTKINTLKKLAASSDKKGLLLMTSGNKLHAFGSDSRYSLLYNVLGLKSVMNADNSAAKERHGKVISFEYIYQANPDYILVIDRDSAIGKSSSAKQLLNNDLIKQTTAAKNNKIIYLDSGIWYLSGGGLISTDKMLTDIKQIL